MERRIFRVSAVTEALSVISLGLAIVTVVSPFWGRFASNDAINSGDLITGYFGLWTVCKDLSSGRSFCGLNVTAFHLTTWTFIAGVMAAVGVVSVGVASIVGILLLLMLKSQERVCLPYRPSVVLRLVLSIFSALMATIAIAMASIRSEERLPYSLYRGWTFYVHIVLIVAEIALTLGAAYDFILSRRLGGDPTFYSRDPSGSNALTYSNPSFSSDYGSRTPTASNGTSTIHSLNSKPSSSLRSISTNGSSNGSRISNSPRNSPRTPYKSPSGRTSPHRSRAGSGRLANGSSHRNGSLYRNGSRGSQRSSRGIAMTASSAHPYSLQNDQGGGGGGGARSSDSIDHSTSSILNSSLGSIETSSSYGTASSIISGSSISSNPMALSPRKSSLKKPNRARNTVPPSPLPICDGNLGFHNVGFAEPRSGSIKRVRIASQNTDV